jgi:DNA-3-methyladenine glycosylase
MPKSPVFPRTFYERSTLLVARELLGARLIRIHEGARLTGIITECEAYIGENDLACHAKAGRTKRTTVMYGPPGHAYVYFTYGNHWMLNVVTEPEDTPAAVLIRAMLPQEGRETILTRRQGRDTSGPGKITQALGIDGRLNGIDLCDPSAELRIEKGQSIPDKDVITGPRVGLFTVPEPWKSIPWRFRVAPSALTE